MITLIAQSPSVGNVQLTAQPPAVGEIRLLAQQPSPESQGVGIVVQGTRINWGSISGTLSAQPDLTRALAEQETFIQELSSTLNNIDLVVLNEDMFVSIQNLVVTVAQLTGMSGTISEILSANSPEDVREILHVLSASDTVDTTSDQDIAGKKTFLDSVYVNQLELIGSPIIDTLIVPLSSLQGVSPLGASLLSSTDPSEIQDLLSLADVVDLSQDQIIDGIKTFTDTVVLSGGMATSSIEFSGTIDGLRLDLFQLRGVSTLGFQLLSSDNHPLQTLGSAASANVEDFAEPFTPQNANVVFMGPLSGSDLPSFRPLNSIDLPQHSHSASDLPLRWIDLVTGYTAIEGPTPTLIGGDKYQYSYSDGTILYRLIDPSTNADSFFAENELITLVATKQISP